MTSNNCFPAFPVLVGFSSLAAAALISPKPITSDIVFPALALFMLLQFPLAMVSHLAAIRLYFINLYDRLISPRFFSRLAVQPGDVEPHRVYRVRSTFVGLLGGG
jgi:hypothetical protein